MLINIKLVIVTYNNIKLLLMSTNLFNFFRNQKLQNDCKLIVKIY